MNDVALQPETGGVDRSALVDLTATQALSLINSHRLSPQLYRQALQARAGQVSTYNAVAAMHPGAATPQQGPLNGVPVLVKDSFDVEGMPTTAGTPALSANIAGSTAPLIQRLLDAGANILAKTVMHELSLGGTSRNGVHGTPKNPWNPERICGGSSGGAASAVALGIAPVSIGADTGGSIRVPAALCGVIGFRPSVGRYPQGGAVPLSPTRDAAGPIARSMEDIVTVDAVLSGQPRKKERRADTTVTLGLIPSHLQDLEPDVSAVFESTQQKLIQSGVRIVALSGQDLLDRAQDIALTLVWGEAGSAIETYLQEQGRISLAELLEQISEPDVALAMRNGMGSVSPKKYRAALIERDALRRELAARLHHAGASGLIYPTTPVVAPKLEDGETLALNGRLVPTFTTLIRHCDFGGTIGLPGISLPVGRGPETGLPVGIELTYPPEADDQLLDLATQLAPLILDVASPTQLVPVHKHSPVA
ncbi:amidase family protein (plasmid) [Arthrobacter sp. D3-18]